MNRATGAARAAIHGAVHGGSRPVIAGIYVLAAGSIVAVLVVGTGGALGPALGGWFRGAFGTGFNLVQTMAYATPLVLIALGVAAALRAGVITIGAEGQMVVGAIVATATALWLGAAVSWWIGLPVGALAGAVGGALWALLPGLAKVRWGVNEILFTLLLNYIAGYLLQFLLRTTLRDPAGSATPQSAPLPHGMLLPQLPLPGRLHIGAVLVAILVVAVLRWSKSRTAFLIGVYGVRPTLAARLGMTPARAVLSTMLVSGVAAGLAGWMQLAGVDGRLQPGVSAGVGFAGIAVTVLGRGNPLGIVAAAIVYASLTTGANGIQLATGTTPASVGTITQGILLLTAALVVAVPTVRSRTAPPDDGSPSAPAGGTSVPHAPATTPPRAHSSVLDHAEVARGGP